MVEKEWQGYRERERVVSVKKGLSLKKTETELAVRASGGCSCFYLQSETYQTKLGFYGGLGQMLWAGSLHAVHLFKVSKV